MKPANRPSRRDRRGNVLVLTAFMLIGMVGFMAFAIDLGYLATARSELQKSADAAAIAAAWDLIENGGTVNLADNITAARNSAVQYASLNRVCSKSPYVDGNAGNVESGDVVVGYLSNPADPACQMTFNDPNSYNAVRVRVSKTAGQNGEVRFFFAPALGIASKGAEAEATAAVISNFKGFRSPGGTGNLDILPFALDKDTWDAMIAGGGNDNWSYNSSTGQVRGGCDGVREVNLYPQGTGSPGNRGTVDIGGANNSTSDLSRQITSGISPQDLKDLGKDLVFDSSGKLSLNGDTGISAGVKDDLASIIGETRVIPLFETVSGNGNNAQYTIVRWVGVRVLDVGLTGKMSNKRVIVQPANVVIRGGIPAEGTQKSEYVYSPAWLVR